MTNMINTKQNIDGFMNKLKNFSILAICFIAVVFVVRLFELASHFSEVTNCRGIVYTNLISCGFIVSIVFIIYAVISIFSKRAALYVSAVSFGVMMLTEVGLSIYYATTGILMGKELIIRPLWEMIHTVESALNIWMILGVIICFCGYVFVTLWLSKKNVGKLVVFAIASVAVASIPLFFTINTNYDKVVVNKTMYCVRECLKDMELDETDYNMDIVDKYIGMFPDRQIDDKNYPLERKDNIDNVLGPYFKHYEDKPNVVVIIVESLGADLFGVNEKGYCYTPFLDSLSEHSLLWVNCMATTPRSFGAIPAITGSVPHGLKGFQFGNIPSHNSLLTILADNGYMTNAFYAGNFSFDKIYDYLVAQKIDYMSPFFQEYKDDKSDAKDGTYWGYHDDVMFRKSMEIIKESGQERPYVDVLVTISQHEDLRLSDKNREKEYYDAANAINPSSGIIGKMAATLYTDDALRHFIKNYNDFDKKGNTIFIITGDHSMNLDDKNPLNAYHVPLIIWSPLLEKTGRFEAMVSHNDITPSILALLRDNFGIKTPETVSWVSDGLDTLQGFHSNIRNYFLHYSRELKDFVWNDYYYTMADNKHPVARIVDGVKIEPIDNDELANDLNDKFKTMVYVDNYVYSHNKIIKSPLSGNEGFKIIKKIVLGDSIYCASGSEKPSLSKVQFTNIFTHHFKTKSDEIKVMLNADIMFTGNIWQDESMMIIVECAGNKMEKVYFADYILKYIVSREPKAGEWQKLELSKIISTNKSDKFELKIYMFPPRKDELWNPSHTVTLKNVNISVLELNN